MSYKVGLEINLPTVRSTRLSSFLLLFDGKTGWWLDATDFIFRFSSFYQIILCFSLALLPKVCFSHCTFPRKRPVEGAERSFEFQQYSIAEMAFADINPHDIDEDLHKHHLAVYGHETMLRISDSNVLVSWMQGLGAEIGFS